MHEINNSNYKQKRIILNFLTSVCVTMEVAKLISAAEIKYETWVRK